MCFQDYTYLIFFWDICSLKSFAAELVVRFNFLGKNAVHFFYCDTISMI